MFRKIPDSIQFLWVFKWNIKGILFNFQENGLSEQKTKTAPPYFTDFIKCTEHCNFIFSKNRKIWMHINILSARSQLHIHFSHSCHTTHWNCFSVLFYWCSVHSYCLTLLFRYKLLDRQRIQVDETHKIAKCELEKNEQQTIWKREKCATCKRHTVGNNNQGRNNNKKVENNESNVKSEKY